MKQRRTYHQLGMTLIEIMVVVVILGILGTLVTVTVMDRLEKARITATKTQIKSLQNALETFRADNGFYPSTEQGLRALIEKPSIGREAKHYPRKGYLMSKEIPRDQWDGEFIYNSPGLHDNDYEISSYGADNREGGEDADADIHSWEMQ